MCLSSYLPRAIPSDGLGRVSGPDWEATCLEHLFFVPLLGVACRTLQASLVPSRQGDRVLLGPGASRLEGRGACSLCWAVRCRCSLCPLPLTLVCLNTKCADPVT